MSTEIFTGTFDAMIDVIQDDNKSKWGDSQRFIQTQLSYRDVCDFLDTCEKLPTREPSSLLFRMLCQKDTRNILHRLLDREELIDEFYEELTEGGVDISEKRTYMKIVDDGMMKTNSSTLGLLWGMLTSPEHANLSGLIHAYISRLWRNDDNTEMIIQTNIALLLLHCYLSVDDICDEFIHPKGFSTEEIDYFGDCQFVTSGVIEDISDEDVDITEFRRKTFKCPDKKDLRFLYNHDDIYLTCSWDKTYYWRVDVMDDAIRHDFVSFLERL